MSSSARALLAICAAFHIAFIATSVRTIEGESILTLFDDAMVSMRYARNLADGAGLVWNPGEAPVEGYTNFLWTLLLAGLHALPIPETHIALAVMILGSALLSVTALSTYSLALRLAKSRSAAAIAGLLTAIYYPSSFWTLRGLEVGLLAFFLIEATRTLLRSDELSPGQARTRLAILLSLALLTRTDAAVAVAILLAYGFMRSNALARRSVIVPAALACAGVLAAHTMFRLSYYGDVFPNTYYLKMTGRPLLDRLREGATAFTATARVHLAPLLLVVAAGAVADPALRRRGGAGLLAALFAGQALYSMFAGGDSWEWMDFSNRFLTVAMPGMFVLAGAAIDSLARRFAPGFLRRAALAAGTVVLTVLLNGAPVRIWLDEGAFHVSDDARMVRFARELRACTKPDATIAVVWAGTVPYHVDRKCIDLLGKNDRVIARLDAVGRFQPGHDKWSARHSIGALEPDVIAQTSLVWQEPGFWPLVHEKGYERLPNGIVARRGAQRFDRECLAEINAPHW
jgi:hypothetical protein